MGYIYMNIKEMFKYFKEKLNFKIIYIVICVDFLVTLLYLNQTHAYYNYEMAPVPIFTSKVGNFAGEGETVKDGPLSGKSTDVNVIWYTQMPDNPKKYKENKEVPVTGFTLNQDISNCYPKNNQEGTTYNPDYTISEDGTVDITVSETKPNQIVCRLYYDRDKISDVIVYAYIQDASGDREYEGSKYKMSSTIPTDKILEGYKCSNEKVATNIGYTDETGFTIDTTGPNTCYAYFK